MWVIRDWTSGLKAALEWLNHLLQPIIQQRSCDGDKACRFSLCQPNSVYLLGLCLFFHFYSIFFSSRGEQLALHIQLKQFCGNKHNLQKSAQAVFFYSKISAINHLSSFRIYVYSFKNETQLLISWLQKPNAALLCHGCCLDPGFAADALSNTMWPYYEDV